LNNKIFKKILIATDGSSYSARAIEYSIEIARMSGSKIFALYVVDTGAFANIPMDMAFGNIYEMLKDEGNKAIRYVEEKGIEEGIEVECFIRDGHPAQEIVKFSEEILADLIIMGTLGKSGFDRFLLGSVAEKVLRNAKIPVMIIRTEKSK
jgi:nucleotide-binding universal stress UspA family protein